MTREEFIELLRDGLSHLYDTDRLRKSPLAAFWGVANRPDAASALRSMLIEAVESLKPQDGTPSQSRDWRFYDALFYAYVQQLEQRTVADQLGLSVRHLRREQHAALEVLADALWEQVDAGAGAQGGAGASAFSNQAGSIGLTLDQELSWLKDLPAERPTDLREVLSEALNIAQSLAAGHRACIQVISGDSLPGLAVHSVVLSQILLNLLSVAIPQAADSEIHISARPLRWEVEIQMRVGRPLSEPLPVSDDDAASLEMACQLTHLCGGRLFLPQEGGTLSATLVLPALNQLVVLAVDDNADALQLLERYTAGTRYRLVGAQDPGQILSLVQKLSPQIIVLDVMMPQVDGWKVMGMLRQHPLTSHIPVVVCTILAQEKLAFSLGASGFVRKPVTRQAFLHVLNRQVERMESAPESFLERGSH